MTPGHIPLAHSCSPVRAILSRVGDKWSMLVVISLRDGPLRFNEIKRMIGSISQRMLTMTVRGLERDGLITRAVTPTTPPRVDYELTPLGHSLRTPVEALGAWAVAHEAEIDVARARFDRRKAARDAAAARRGGAASNDRAAARDGSAARGGAAVTRARAIATRDGEAAARAAAAPRKEAAR